MKVMVKKRWLVEIWLVGVVMFFWWVNRWYLMVKGIRFKKLSNYWLGVWCKIKVVIRVSLIKMLVLV